MNSAIALRLAIVVAVGVVYPGLAPIALAQTAESTAAGQLDGKPDSYPDASSTGVPAGMALSKQNGTIEITTDGAVLEGIDLVGNVVISARDVTIRKSRINSGTAYHLIRVMDGSTGFRLEDSELIGNGTTTNGVLGPGTFLRNNIHGFENGLAIWGPSHIEGNFIHDLQGGPDAHFDTIECNGGSDIAVIGNTLVNEFGQTAVLMLNNQFAALQNWVVEGNRLIGGGYTMYIDYRKSSLPVGNIRISNNRWSSGQYGYTAFYGYVPDEWSGNVDDATGAPISP